MANNIKIESYELLYMCNKKDALYFSYFLLIYEFSTYIANDMIMPGMINVIKYFSASENMISTSLSAFILGGASLQVILGPLSDQIGRRPVMLFGAFFFILCTIFIAVAQSIEIFILGRFFQGMSLCFITVIGYAALQEIFSESYAVRLIALMNNITILAPLAGPLAGAVIVTFFSWRVIFLLIFILAAIAFFGLWMYMPETVGRKKIDKTYNEPTPFSFKIIKNNYIDLVCNKSFMCGTFAVAIINIPIIAWIGAAPIILMKNAQLSVTGYAVCQIPIFFSAIVGNLIMRQKVYITPLSNIIRLGSVILILSLILMPVLTFILKNNFLAILIGISIYSLCLGYINSPLNRKTLFSTPIPKGTASAMLSLILMIMTAMGNQVAGIAYISNNNLYFAMFCAICGVIYFPIYILYRKFS